MLNLNEVNRKQLFRTNFSVLFGFNVLFNLSKTSNSKSERTKE